MIGLEIEHGKEHMLRELFYAENLNKYLNKILASMRKNIATTNRVIKKQSTQISRRRDIIERKNHKIKKQDEDIAKTNTRYDFKR